MTDIKHHKLDYNKRTDAELIQDFQKGEESAFSQIFVRYQQRLLQFASAVLGDENDAMDMVQETYIRAYFNLGSFRGDSSLYTWLYRILYNLCISLLRKKKLVSFLSFTSHDEDFNLASREPDPVEIYERKEIMEAVKHAMKQLPVRQRMVFSLKQLDGLKHSEIAEIMGISDGAVKASYFHAVKKLRKLLIWYGGDYEM